MSRQEKGSRMRMLPPRVQLQQRDALTGSYPTNVRFSIDGRTGNYPISYDDTYAVVFTGSDNYIPGIGFTEDSIWLLNSASNDLTGSIITTGSVRSQVIEGLPFFHFTPGQELTPFRDNDQPAVDGKSTNDSFFATGSAIADIGEGFNGPLWSKNKIEIDISVVSPTTMSLVSGSVVSIFPFLFPEYNKSFPMAYYNFDEKKWDLIGLGEVVNSVQTYDDQLSRVYGFANTLFPGGTAKFIDIGSAGYPISDFGFPFNVNFHATSSQTLKMNQYIDEPFMLEKAVIEVSGSWNIGSIKSSTYFPTSTPFLNRNVITCSINTCFLLNQRKNQSFSFSKTLSYLQIEAATKNYQVPSTTYLTYPLTTPVYVDTCRDILGFSQIFSFANGAYEAPLYDNLTGETSVAKDQLKISDTDIVITSSIAGLSGANWSKKLNIEMVMKSPFGLANRNFIAFNLTGSKAIDMGFDGGRSGLGMRNLTGRSYKNDYQSFSYEREFNNIILPNNKSSINPYVLMPSDELILGWQMPISNKTPRGIVPNESESTFIFHPGQFKLTLYGSYIREDREYNDSLNQLLSSDGIHEVIGE